MVCVWRLVLATFACVGKSEGFCCWWSATGDPCDCSETSKASNLATSLACVDGGGSWCSEDGEQSAPEDGEQSADGGEQSAPEDGSSSCACRSIMAGITDEWCQQSDCDPAFAAQCSSACPTAPGATPAPTAKPVATPAPTPPVTAPNWGRGRDRLGAPPPPRPVPAPQPGCERNWLFQVSTGRSGSTSLMTMLNDLPNVYIAGENDGLFESLYALHKSSIRTESRAKGKNGVHNAWWHHPVERSKLRRSARTYVESAIGLKQNQNYTWVGFKEIRFRTDDELDYILSLFPCSKVIVNIRRDVVRQHKSAFKRSSPISKLKSHNDMLLKWSTKHRNRVFTLALEDFTLANLNRLAVWLDFPNCHFKQIAHANRNGGYGVDNRHFVTC